MTLFLHSIFRSADQVGCRPIDDHCPRYESVWLWEVENASSPGNSVHVSLWAWVLFGTLVLLALALDLELLHGKRNEQRRLTLRAAALRNGAWVALALLFGLGVLAVYGQAAALTYVTAYLLEQSLSIDNVFVFVLIFSELRIPPAQQRSVLLWGVLGALVMRALLIGAGLLLLNRFHWVVYPFAALIIFAAFRLVWGTQKEQELVVAARSIYFVLAGVVDRFRYLRVGLAAILIFFGARLLLGDVLEVPTGVSLGVIAAGLALSVAASIKWPGPSARPASSG